MDNPHQRDHTNYLNNNNGEVNEDPIIVAGDLSRRSVIPEVHDMVGVALCLFLVGKFSNTELYAGNLYSSESQQVDVILNTKTFQFPPKVVKK